MANKKIRLCHALLWTVTVTVLSLMKFGDVAGDVKIPYKDKMVHFVFYFFFVLLWFRYKKTSNTGTRTSFIICIIAILYGLLIECCQSLFTTSRTADIYDVAANSSGALTAWLFIGCGFLNKRKI